MVKGTQKSLFAVLLMCALLAIGFLISKPVYADSLSFINPDGSSATLDSNNGGQFVWQSPQELVAFNGKTYKTNAAPCNGDTNGMYTCNGNSNDHQGGFESGYYWYWPTNDGSAITTPVNNACPSAFVVEVTDGTGKANIYRVNLEINGLKTHCYFNVNDDYGKWSLSDSQVQGKHGHNDEAGPSNNDYYSNAFQNPASKNEVNGISRNKTSLFAFATEFRWDDQNTIELLPGGDKFVYQDPSNSSAQNIIKSIQQKLKNSNNTKKYLSYKYYVTDKCTSNGNAVKSFIAVDPSNPGTAQILHLSGNSTSADHYDTDWWAGNGPDACMFGGNTYQNSPDVLWGGSTGDAAIGIGDVANATAAPGQGSPPVTGGGGQGTGSSGSDALDCHAGAWNWIVCPVITMATAAAEKVDGFIVNIMNVDVKDTFGNQQYKTAWNSFRILAIALLVIAGLAMVVAQALGFEALDAYTIRKVLPRLLVAIIGISLSWVIMSFIVQFFDDVGFGIRNLIYAPFSTIKHDVGVGANLITILGTGGIFLVMGPAALTFILTGLLAVFVGFLTLVVRQIIILILIIVAPIAIACYILPNTQKVWKMWFDTFMGMMMVFPIYSAMVAAAHVFSAMSLSGQVGGLSGTVAQVIGIIAYFIPYFMLPVILRFAGGFMGQLAGFVNDKHKGAFDRLKGARQNATQRRWQDLRAGHRFAGGNDTNWRGRLNRGLSHAGNINQAGYNPRNWRANMATAAGTRAQNEIEENLKDNRDYATWSGDDDLNRAASESHDERSLRAALQRADARRVARGEAARFNSPEAMNQAVARVQRVRRNMSSDAFRQMTTLQSLAGGTAYDTAGEAWEAVARAGGNDEAATAFLVKNGRDALMKSGRVDQGGGSFGTTLSSVRQMQDELRATGTVSAATRDTVTETITDSAIDSSSPGQAVYGKPSSARQLAQAHTRRIAAALNNASDVAAGVAAGTHTQDQLYAAEREAKQAMASAAGLYDEMGRASPQNAREFANGLTGAGLAISALPPDLRSAMALRPDGKSSAAGNISVLDGIENLRAHDREFAEMRRDYGSQVAAEAAHMGGMGGVPGPGGPPAGGPPGGPPGGP